MVAYVLSVLESPIRLQHVILKSEATKNLPAILHDHVALIRPRLTYDQRPAW